MAPSSEFGRRTFLRRGLQGGALLALTGASGGLLAACGSSSSSSTATTTAGGTATAKKLGLFTFQFNWINDVSWSSSYLAKEMNVYQAQGFDLGANFLYGGPNVAVEPIIVAGKANMGFCNSETFAAAVRQGAPLKAIGAYLQINPFCITSLADHPINTPQDMIGKKIGVQALNDSLWAALLKINNIDASKVTKVVSQFDPAPLTTGEVDGFLSFINNQPITLQLKGYKVVNMKLQDYGFTLYQQLYAVTDDALKNQPDVVLAGLRSELIGKQLILQHKDQALQLSLTKYSKDLNQDPSYAQQAQEAYFGLSTSPATIAHGIAYMSPEDVAKNVATLKQLGLEIPASSYTTKILDQVYSKGLTLI